MHQLLSYSCVEQNGPEIISQFTLQQTNRASQETACLSYKRCVFFHIPLLVLSISALFSAERDNFGGKQCAHAHKPRYFLPLKKSRNIANSRLPQNSTAHAGVRLRHGFTQLAIRKLVCRMLLALCIFQHYSMQ